MLKKLVLVSKLLAFLSILFFVGYFFNRSLYYYPLYMPSVGEIKTSLNFGKKEPQITLPEVAYGRPVRVSVQSVGIDLAIEEGSYNKETQTWSIDEAKAFYANLSDLPANINGNTVVYAHNKKDAFYNLKDIKPGDKIMLTLDSGKVFTYEYFGDEVVSPENSQVFSYDDMPRLTLITCDGNLSLERRLVYGRLIQS